MIASILLMALNVGFFVGGGAVLAIGILALVKPEIIYQLTDYLTNSLGNTFSDLSVLKSFDLQALIEKNAIILIAVGGFLFLFGFLGFCGAMKRSSVLLSAYAYLVLAILCGEAALAVYGYMYSDKLEVELKSGLRLALDQYQQGFAFVGTGLVIPRGGDDIAWDAVQVQLMCCGVESYKDWKNAAKWNNSYGSITAAVPPSCCKRTEVGSTKEINDLQKADFVSIQNCLTGDTSALNEKGCYLTLRDLVLSNKTIVIAVFAVVILVELLAIGCACWLKNSLK